MPPRWAGAAGAIRCGTADGCTAEGCTADGCGACWAARMAARWSARRMADQLGGPIRVTGISP